MAFRVYLVPVVGDGTKENPRVPKYFSTDVDEDWESKDFGEEPVMLVGADLSASHDNFVIGQPDVTALPFDLSQTLTGGQVNATQNKLEAVNIPAGWVNTSLTWLQVLRTMLGMSTFMQRYAFIYGQNTGNVSPSLFAEGVSLATTFNQLPLAVRTALIDTAVSLGISTTGLAGSTTVRVILKTLADQFQSTQYPLNGVLI